jgi:hypothetical protein
MQGMRRSSARVGLLGDAEIEPGSSNFEPSLCVRTRRLKFATETEARIPPWLQQKIQKEALQRSLGVWVTRGNVAHIFRGADVPL